MSYISSSLKFYNNKIVVEDTGSNYNGIEVMMDWEDDIMSASAAYVTEGGGDILEIGFGMGISAGYIQSHSISSHTIIENHPQILEKLKTWANGKSNINIIKEQDIDSTGITFSLNDGIRKLNYRRRQSPNYFQMEVNDSEMIYQHHTLPTGITMGKLQGKFDYTDEARQEAFYTSVQEDGKSEISIDVTKGHYLEIGNTINLSLREYPEITGKHRIVAKKINITKTAITCLLTLSKDKITLGDYFINS